ncbi:MAG: 16S rRNA (guanine(527)-N(7))-methyltransferase RsmG [Chloroflexi bacterium]|nr:16S rRNA (guanine(527)-N(7))-methyltransferase RsmG [Chloroflexota bacterium]
MPKSTVTVKYLTEVLDQLSFFTDAEARRGLSSYRAMLITGREAARLTSLSDPDEIERRHIGESLILLEYLEARGLFASPAIDIGAGAGAPGLPIKIARPDLRLTLVEATAKKAAFLGKVVSSLELGDVTVVNARSEDAARDSSHRARYALVLARAVAPLPTLVELALPFLAVGGRLATPKGSRARDEVEAARHALSECGGEVETVDSLSLPWEGPAPTIVIVRKVAATPERYPRRAGIPAKRPL